MTPPIRPAGPPASRLRIIVDGAILSRPPTGTARWVRGLSAALAERPDIEAMLTRGPSYISRWGRLHRIPNLVRERWWYELGLPAIARRARVDALLMPSNLTARPGAVPQIASILDVNFLTQPGTYERTFVRYATWAYRKSTRDAVRLTTLSEFSRSQISEHLQIDARRLQVVYPGLDEIKAGRMGPSPHDHPYALYVGSTERHKNVGLLLAAWRHRSPAGLDLAIVGQPGRDHSTVIEGAVRAGGRVTVSGQVDRDRLEDWYRHASLFVFPSKVEGFGYPPLEAMQRGVAVVSSTGGSLPEVLGNAASFFDPGDETGLIERIEELMADGPRRLKMIELGRQRARRYAWASTARAMSDILHEAVAETGLRSLDR